MLPFNQLWPLCLLAVLIVNGCQPIQSLAPTLVTAAPTSTLTALLPDTASAPHFLRTACLYRIPPEANVTCGYLVVPEDRSQPAGKTIRLHVVIFQSASEPPAPDPVILLNGGPGQVDHAAASQQYPDLAVDWGL